MQKSKLLVITSKDDGHADYVINILNQTGRGDQVVRLNTEDFMHNVEVAFNGDHYRITILDSQKEICSPEIKSVWFRRPKPFEPTCQSANTIQTFIHAEYEALLRGLYFCCHDSAKWMNPLPALHRSRIKMQQLQLAKRLGFRVPKTLITNSPTEAIQFMDTLSGRACYKPLGEHGFEVGAELFTRIVTRDDVVSKQSSLRQAPIILQEFIEKRYDIRVIVFEEHVFAFEIHSQEHELSQHDFRGVSPELIPHKIHRLPCQLEQKIRAFVQTQGLIYSAMDLVYTDTQEYFFLENNANGQWLWLELLTGATLTKCLIDVMLGIP